MPGIRRHSRSSAVHVQVRSAHARVVLVDRAGAVLDESAGRLIAVAPRWRLSRQRPGAFARHSGGPVGLGRCIFGKDPRLRDALLKKFVTYITSPSPQKLPLTRSRRWRSNHRRLAALAPAGTGPLWSKHLRRAGPRRGRSLHRVCSKWVNPGQDVSAFELS